MQPTPEYHGYLALREWNLNKKKQKQSWVFDQMQLSACGFCPRDPRFNNFISQ